MLPQKFPETSFKNKALKEAEEYFKNVHISQFQHKIFNDLIEIFLKYISINELAAKGIGWRSISKWQLQHKRDLIGLEEEPPEERIKGVKQIIDVLKNELTEILEDPAEEPLLDRSVNEILKFYKEKYAFRKRTNY